MKRPRVALPWCPLMAALFACMFVTFSPAAGSIRVSSSMTSLDALQNDFERFAVRSSRRRVKPRAMQDTSCALPSLLCGSVSPVCTNVTTDINNCGKCSHFCRIGEGCCGGECVDLTTSKANCGDCGNVCASQCISGLCGYGTS